MRRTLPARATRGLQSLGHCASGSRRTGSLRVVAPFLNVKSRSRRIPIRTDCDRPEIEKQAALPLTVPTFNADLAQVPIRGYGAFAARYEPPPTATALLLHDGIDLVERRDGDRSLGARSGEHCDRSTRLQTPAEDGQRGDRGREAQERFHHCVVVAADEPPAVGARPHGSLFRVTRTDRQLKHWM